jgi:hypothetical protein
MLRHGSRRVPVNGEIFHVDRDPFFASVEPWLDLDGVEEFIALKIAGSGLAQQPHVFHCSDVCTPKHSAQRPTAKIFGLRN